MSLTVESTSHSKSWPILIKSPKVRAYTDLRKVEKAATASSRSAHPSRYLRGERKATKISALSKSYAPLDITIIDGNTTQSRGKQELNVEEIFRRNSEKWKEDSMFTSSITAMVLHPSYQRIIGLGPAAIPFIIRDLEESGDQWFWALEAISGANPVVDENIGNPEAMAAQWAVWATVNGYK